MSNQFLHFFTLTLILYGLNTSAQEKVTVATAANMQVALNKIKTAFEKETGIKVEIITGSSGKLTAQIKERAPYDVFVSADMVYPQEIYNSGLATEKPMAYATGQLVLWSNRADLTPDVALTILRKQEVKKIAIANPKIAPYGRAAEEALHYYKMYEQVSSKLVFGENIGQTQQFVATRAADIGFVAKSQVLSDETNGKGNWIDIDRKAYTPIVQGAVLLKHGAETNKAASGKFYEYLYSLKAKQILEQCGYIVR